MKAIALAVILVLNACAFAGDLSKHIWVQAVANQSSNNGNNAWSYSVLIDGEAKKPLKNWMIETAVKANYARDEDRVTTDFLQTNFRLLSTTKKNQRLLLVRTTGDLSFESLNLLVAPGYRFLLKGGNGYIETTAGASKELQSADIWKLDLGVEARYSKKFGKLTVNTGQRTAFDGLSGIRLEGDKLTFSADVRLDYRLNEKLGIGYALLYSDIGNPSKKTQNQTIGLTYRN